MARTKKYLPRKRGPTRTVPAGSEKKKCKHCNGWMLPSHFDLRPDGKRMVLCHYCREKRKRIPSRLSYENTAVKTRNLLTLLTSSNTCEQCADTQGPFTFFRRDTHTHGKAYMVSEAVQRGMNALQQALNASKALCPRCTQVERKRIARIKRPKMKAKPASYNVCPVAPPRLAALFPLLRNERKVESRAVCGKLPNNVTDLLRYGDRIAKGHQTLLTPLRSSLLPNIKPNETA